MRDIEKEKTTEHKSRKERTIDEQEKFLDDFYPSMAKNKENEKAALTSFIYNVGTGAFKNSTLLKKLNEGDKKGAADELDKWVYQRGQKLNGLVDRRKKEKDLFLTPDES